MCRVSDEWVMSLKQTYWARNVLMSLLNVSCFSGMSHVPIEWVMSLLNVPCLPWMSHVSVECVVSLMNESCPYWMSHVWAHLSISELTSTLAPFEKCLFLWNNTLYHTATHCNTLQHTATHCKTLDTTRWNTLQHTATHCNTLQHTWAKRSLTTSRPLYIPPISWPPPTSPPLAQKPETDFSNSELTCSLRTLCEVLCVREIEIYLSDTRTFRDSNVFFGHTYIALSLTHNVFLLL